VFGKASEDIGRGASFGWLDSFGNIHDVGLKVGLSAVSMKMGYGPQLPLPRTGDRCSMSGLSPGELG